MGGGWIFFSGMWQGLPEPWVRVQGGLENMQGVVQVGKWGMG